MVSVQEGLDVLIIFSIITRTYISVTSDYSYCNGVPICYSWMGQMANYFFNNRRIKNTCIAVTSDYSHLNAICESQSIELITASCQQDLWENKMQGKGLA